MALPAEAPRRSPKGRSLPRVAPPTPARSDWRAFRQQAADLGITLYPWQEQAARYLEALGPGAQWLYPEVAVIVARQEGKTTLLVPLIVKRLRAGRHIMHSAQNRELPREIHDRVASLMLEHYPDELPKRRGIRYGAGQEEIHLTGGGSYRIVAPTRGGARGPANDDVIVDELREMESHDFIGAAKPSLSASRNPQIIYLSNAGTEESEVLNAIRRRAGVDPSLAYLEWSAAPERKADDLAGWLEANPSIGHNPTKLGYLRREYESHRLAGTLGIFETEHLCRWVASIKRRYLTVEAWEAAEGDVPEPSTRAVLGLSMDANATRASASLAWRIDAQRVAVRLVADVSGDPIDVERLGPDLRQLAARLRVRSIVYDPWSAPLARYLRGAREMTGRQYATACADFVRLVEGGGLTWADAAPVGADLLWTDARSTTDGGVLAVAASLEHPITALLSAVRATWLASAPTPPAPRIM